MARSASGRFDRMLRLGGFDTEDANYVCRGCGEGFDRRPRRCPECEGETVERMAV
jgi:predicted Zn-ribbon and HTH transcriptional regulator